MRKTIWGKLCGPYGVCLEESLAQVLTGLFSVVELLSTCWSRDICTLRNLYFVGGPAVDLYFDGGTLFCTLLELLPTWCSRDICTLRNLYFVGVCTLLGMR